MPRAGRARAYLNGDALARAVRDDGLPWDPSVVALVPFPTLLDMMSGDMAWTQDLGNAVLANRGAVMDAVQQQRALALCYGYLQSNGQVRVVNAGPGDIEILPIDPAFVYVPLLQPVCGLRPAEAGVLRGRRHHVRTADRRWLIRALGLGRRALRMARSSHRDQ
jgi:hypothetical protein